MRGSTVALSDESGNVVDRFQYSPYAGLMSHSPVMVDTPFLYNGRDGVMTDDTGLYYMRARYYNPEIRRFVNQDVLLGDIVEGQTLNRYAYVTGEPVSFVDPFGLEESKSNDYNNLKNIHIPGIFDIADLRSTLNRELGISTELTDFLVNFSFGLENAIKSNFRDVNWLSITRVVLQSSILYGKETFRRSKFKAENIFKKLGIITTVIFSTVNVEQAYQKEGIYGAVKQSTIEGSAIVAGIGGVVLCSPSTLSGLIIVCAVVAGETAKLITTEIFLVGESYIGKINTKNICVR